MSLYLSQVGGTVKVNGVALDPEDPTAVYPVSMPDYVETGANGTVTVFTDARATQMAAVISGPSATVRMFVPPAQAVVNTYYARSYRRQLGTQVGTVGVQG